MADKTAISAGTPLFSHIASPPSRCIIPEEETTELGPWQTGSYAARNPYKLNYN